MPEFVNPYTFIPLAEKLIKTRPNGHDRLAHLAGTLSVRLTAATALIIRADVDSGVVPVRDGRVVIHGSGLHGAIRSLHETLAGGCLRVIDPDYLPSYRQVVEAGLDDTVMGVVEAVDAAGRATSIRLCDRETWLDADEVFRILGPVDTGERVWVDDTLLGASTWRNARYEIPARLTTGRSGWLSRSDAPTMGAPMVAFLTDVAARDPRRGHYWAFGPLGDEVVGVAPAASRAFAHAVAGTEDVRLRNASGAPESTGPSVPVTRGGRVLGRRFAASARLQVGQPVWVAVEQRPGGTIVTEIRLAKVWRRTGGGELRDRVRGFLPCSDREEIGELMLCPSCAVFGSAEERRPDRTENDKSVQRSYAGHVMIGDARSIRPATAVVERATSIAPLMGPHPGSGHFYLQPATKGYRGETTWGAEPDESAPREVRGRKFYWRSRNPRGVSRSLRAVPRGAQNTARAVPVQPVKRGTEFELEIQFYNLTPQQLGGLIVAIKPDLLFGGAVLSIGAGKPFGFGAVTAHVELTDVYTSAERYGAAPALDRDAVQRHAVDAFRTWRTETGLFHRVDPAARHVLRLDFIEDDLISYPFDSTQIHAGDPRPGYRFFKAARGGEAGTAAAPLFLPDPASDAAAQAMDNRHGAR